MDRNEIMNILPHRENMLLVDEAWVEYDEESDCSVSHGKYHVKGDEFFLQGHFPGNPVVPGVILCEMMAQSCCVLLADEIEEGTGTLFSGLKEVKFRNPVRPGDTFESKCRITRRMGAFCFAKGEGYVDGKLAVKGEFSFVLVGPEAGGRSGAKSDKTDGGENSKSATTDSIEGIKSSNADSGINTKSANTDSSEGER